MRALTELLHVRHSSCSRSLNHLNDALSVGLPGLVKSKGMAFSRTHCSIARGVSSVPLSTVIERCNIRCRATRDTLAGEPLSTPEVVSQSEIGRS